MKLKKQEIHTIQENVAKDAGKFALQTAIESNNGLIPLYSTDKNEVSAIKTIYLSQFDDTKYVEDTIEKYKKEYNNNELQLDYINKLKDINKKEIVKLAKKYDCTVLNTPNLLEVAGLSQGLLNIALKQNIAMFLVTTEGRYRAPRMYTASYAYRFIKHTEPNHRELISVKSRDKKIKIHFHMKNELFTEGLRYKI